MRRLSSLAPPFFKATLQMYYAKKSSMLDYHINKEKLAFG